MYKCSTRNRDSSYEEEITQEIKRRYQNEHFPTRNLSVSNRRIRVNERRPSVSRTKRDCDVPFLPNANKSRKESRFSIVEEQWRNNVHFRGKIENQFYPTIFSGNPPIFSLIELRNWQVRWLHTDAYIDAAVQSHILFKIRVEANEPHVNRLNGFLYARLCASPLKVGRSNWRPTCL